MFSFCASVPLSARELSEREQKALSYLRELAFEVTRYNITGFSPLPEGASFSAISRIGSNLMAQHKAVGSVKNPVYLCEYYFPHRIGIIDSTFSAESLYALHDEGGGEETVSFDWIDVMLRSFSAETSPARGAQPAFEAGILDGSKILEMLENNDSRGIEAQDEGKGAPGLPPELSYTKRDGSLRRFSYDGEQFTTWKDGADTVLVNFYGSSLVRKRFDELYRLVANERFKTASSARGMSLESSVSYEYAADSGILAKSVEEQVAAKKRRESWFDGAGRVTSLLESHYEEREVKSPKKTKNAAATKETVLLDDRKTSKVYDAQGRTAEEEVRTWSYRTNTFGRSIVEERTVKNVYDYSAVTEENKLPPNVRFYEDGELHLERQYSGSGAYSERLYFDGGFSVELLYESDMKKTEIIYLNGEEQRRREFEY